MVIFYYYHVHGAHRRYEHWVKEGYSLNAEYQRGREELLKLEPEAIILSSKVYSEFKSF